MNLLRSESMEHDEDDDELLETDGYNEVDPEDIHKSETPEKRKRRLRIARLKKKAKQRAYEFSGQSDIAGVLFLEIGKLTDLPPERNGTSIPISPIEL